MDAKNKKFNSETYIFLTQIIVIITLLLAVIVIKFVNGNWFNIVKGYYVGNFAGDTRVSEVTEADEEKITYLTDKKTVLASQNLILNKNYNNQLVLPLNEYIVSSGYGWRKDPFGNGVEFHKGIDMAATEGVEIKASACGVIELAQYSNSYGNYIIINHGSGLKTLYAHCNNLLKNVGDNVESGEVIALVGSTGRSTGPHLHFEIILNSKNLNPEWYLNS